VAAGNYREDHEAVPFDPGGAMTPDARWDADAAVEELYAAHYLRLVRLAVLLVRDVATAEELVQDSLVAMHGRWRSLRDTERGLAYLQQTVVNRSRSVVRRRPASYAPAPSGEPGNTPSSERRAAALDALRALPERQREVLALAYYLDLPEAQVADTLGISRAAVRRNASRAVAALRSLTEDVA
jgi:RNA polymerase sigma-70 factor (sigma-E family)